MLLTDRQMRPSVSCLISTSITDPRSAKRVALASRFDGNVAEAGRALDAVLETIVQQTAAGEKVSLTGFGVFERVHRSARMVRNPATGSRTPKDAMFVPRFRAGLLFKRAVAGAAESNSSQQGMGVGERA